MKIGILTFTNTRSDGASLQALALCSVLNLINGVSAEVIRYSCSKIYSDNLPRVFTRNKSVRHIIGDILVNKSRKEKYRNFRKFESENNTFSCKEYTRSELSELEKDYDKIIVGSDQVWNLQLTGMDYSFYLDLIENINKKYAYAASFGNYERCFEDKPELKQFLSEFRFITVREQSAALLIKNSTGRSVEVAADPVVLPEVSFWRNFISAVPPVNYPYILVYMLNDLDNRTVDKLEKLSIDLNSKVILLTNAYMTKGKNFIKVRNTSPKDFLNYIYYSKAVISGSFHAVCFAALFEKRFVCLKNKSDKGTRIDNLMEQLGLLDLIYTDITDIKLPDSISTTEKFESMRRNSLNIINKMIED